MPSRFPQLQKPINPIAAFTQIPTTDPVENVLGRVKELEDRIGEAKFKRRYNEVRRLEVQLNRQKRYLENIGVSTGGGPSILSRVLGVVSAPVSGIAEATKRVLDPKGGSGLSDVGAAISGLGSGTFSSLTKGLEGTTSFSDVLKEHGVKGPLNAGLGLGLDIALDPTTYVTLGSSAALKGGIKGTRLASKTLGAKAGVKALEQKSVQQLGRRAVQDAKRVGNAKRIAERLGKEAMEDVALGTATRVSSKALREKAPRLQVKFLGQPILESQKAYRGLAFVGDRIGKTSTGDWINKGFRTAARFPGRTNTLRRMYESQGIANANEATKEIRSLFKGLSKEEKRHISHAIEGNYELTGNLEKARQDAVAFFDDLFDMESFELGLFDETQKIPGYVYHYYRAPISKNSRQLKNQRAKYRAVGTEKPGFAKGRIIPTLEKAKELNLKPVEEIDDILALRTYKSFEVRARQKFVEAVSKEYGVNVATKEGKTLVKKLGLKKANSEFVSEGIYFPEEVADSLGFLQKLRESPDELDRLFRVFDKGQGYWKFFATAANPGHHIRNMQGDMWLNYLDGVVNPLRYEQAAKVIFSDNPAKLKIKVGKRILSGEDIKRLYTKSGSNAGFFRTEFINDKQLGRGAIAKIRELSEKREDFTRLAHFIDVLKKEAGNKYPKLVDLDRFADVASAKVRKFNIDYGDLTEFERHFMKRIIPFYTWIRKNIPLQMEMLATRPGRFAALPKSIKAIQQFLGTDEYDPSVGEIIPKWVMEMAPIRLRGEGESANAIWWTPSIPVQDISRYLEGGQQGILRSLLSDTTPALRVPIELATGQQLFTGAPTKSNLQFGAEQIPGARVVSNLLELRNKPEETAIAEDSRKSRIKESLFNYLTGLGVREITGQRQLGELRRQQDPIQKLIAESRKPKRG